MLPGIDIGGDGCLPASVYKNDFNFELMICTQFLCSDECCEGCE